MAIWTVNGKPFTADTVLARPRLGTVEKWTIRATQAEHPFYIHLAPFQVLNRGTTGQPGD